MTKPSNIESIEKGTGRTWDEWIDLLVAAGAQEMTHTEIADLVHNEFGVDGWWAQSVTVAYEQHIGRRVPGQVADGTFEVAATRVLEGSKDDVMARFINAFDGITDLNSTGILSTRTSGTDKRLYWKANLADDTRTIVASEDKPGGKALLSATQVKVRTADDAEKWKAFWKDKLAQL